MVWDYDSICKLRRLKPYRENRGGANDWYCGWGISVWRLEKRRNESIRLEDWSAYV